MWAPRTAPRLLSLQVQQGSCRAQKNSPSTGVSISAGITVLGSNQLGSGGWPCITPSLASTSVALEEPSGNRIAARESGRWGEAKVELWHGLFSMIHVRSSMPCHKASGNTIPTNVPLWFSEFQSLLPAAVEEQLVPAKLVLEGGYWCKHLRQYNKMDLKRRGGCFCLTSAQFLLTGKQAFVSHGRIILNC